MITDFPEVKRRLEKVVNAVLRQKFKENTPMLSMGTHKTIHEGDKMGVLRENGQHSLRNLHYAESGFSIRLEEIPTMRPDELLNKVTGAAVDLAGQVERQLLNILDEELEKNGNVVSSNLNDFILMGLEKIAISFEDDDRAKPIMPTIFAGPDLVEKIKEQASKTTPEEKEDFDNKSRLILDKKYVEYLEDLESRKIID